MGRGFRRAWRRRALTPGTAGHIVRRISRLSFLTLGGTAMTRLITSKLTVLSALIMGWIITLFVIIANQM
ncbi:hypothetical protein GCM10010470_53600 [Saccharopolyspora taberi]|uniref:Uncharacterized protein n=1 Tax=Saccharopolyspora taberi TaxID=60895 RepID=A0ABN3VL22_9PSEU